MERIGIPLEHERRAPLGGLLGDLLIDLVSLALNGDHARWHVVGPYAPRVREELERFTTEARAWAQRLAERAVIIGVPVDGRPSAIGRARALKELPFGLVADRETTEEIAHQVSDVVVRARVALEPLASIEPVTHHLVIEILESLERWLWRFQVQCSDRPQFDAEGPVGEIRQLKPAGA